ncbi:MAG: hypothetical protein OEY52_11720 [Gammaproteobacteria bacterium]|nr:hypothetical protein [Gammaproteobacteria bacterium]
MDKLRHKIKSNSTISLLLIVAVLLSGFQTIHYHIHHHADLNTGVHQHDIDLHTSPDSSHHDENTQIFEASPQGMSKKFSQVNIELGLLFSILLILPVIQYRLFFRASKTIHGNWQHYFYLSRQLRAPPLSHHTI